MLLVSGEWRPEMLLNILQWTGQASATKNCLDQIPTAPPVKPHETDAVCTRLMLSWRLQFSGEEKQQRNDHSQHTMTSVKKAEAGGQGE